MYNYKIIVNDTLFQHMMKVPIHLLHQHNFTKNVVFKFLLKYLRLSKNMQSQIVFTIQMHASQGVWTNLDNVCNISLDSSTYEF